MAKFHINAKGEAGKCSATQGGCPFGDANEHYTSPEAAREAFENKMGSETTFGKNLAEADEKKLLAIKEQHGAVIAQEVHTLYQEAQAIADLRVKKGKLKLASDKLGKYADKADYFEHRDLTKEVDEKVAALQAKGYSWREIIESETRAKPLDEITKAVLAKKNSSKN